MIGPKVVCPPKTISLTIKKLKKMKKLTIKELMGVRGGKSSVECKKVQALAAAYIRDGASDAAWDEWADEFNKHC